MKVRGVKISSLLVATLLAVMICMPAMAIAAPTTTTKYPWNIPDNVRIVQKAPVDNVRTFATIQAAINSITTATSTNPFIVKVMPGVYNESVTMKNFVAVEGSGKDSTVITFAGRVVTVPDNVTTTLKGVTVMITGIFNSVGIDCALGTSFEFINSKLSYNGTGGNCALYSRGSNLLFSNSIVDLRTTGNGIYGLSHDCDNVVVENSSIYIESAGELDVFNVGKSSTVTKVLNSTVTLLSTQNLFGSVSLVFGNGNFEIINSSINVKSLATQTNTSIFKGGTSKVLNSKLTSSSYIINSTSGSVDITNSVVNSQQFSNGGTFRVAISQLAGGFPSSGDKLTNCIDGNFNPVANQ